MYLTYDEYLDMGGTLDETTFDDFEFEAESIINYYTFNRLVNDTTVDVKVKKLVKVLIEIAIKQDNSISLGKSVSNTDVPLYISKQTNDGVSTDYNGMSASTLYQVSKNEMAKAIQRYLGTVTNELGQKVLYRGLYKGE